MDHSSKLIAVLLAAFSASAHAAYSNLSPPPGWSAGGSAAWATPSNGFAAQMANQWIANAAKSSAMLNVGGRQTAVNALLPLAANAPRIAAGVIFAHPYVRTGLGIAAWLATSSVMWDDVNKIWREVGNEEDQPIKQYRYETQPWTTLSGACDQALAAQNLADAGTPYTSTLKSCQPGGAILARKGPWDTVDFGRPIQERTNPATGGCPTGWTPSPAGCLSPQLTQQRMVDLLNPANQIGWPMPSTVPSELPLGIPLPVKVPIINPSDEPNPQPRPLFVPTGNPVPNPQYDPNAPPGPNNQPYIQPGVRVVPSPTQSEPWRVDIQPVNRPQENLNPNPEPGTEPGTDPADKPKPEEQQSLCEKHPDIVACAKLGEPGQATPVPNETKTLTIAPENGFGPSGGSCPPPRTVQVAGLTLSMPFDLLCDFATGLKPVIVGLAWLTAAFTFMGIGRRS